VRNNSTEWIDIQKEFFYKLYIPTLKKHYLEGDVVIHCGDVFDAKQNINTLVMNEALDIVKSISDICPVYIMLGNHDLYRKNNNDINSCKFFRYMSGITLVDNTLTLDAVSNKKLFLMAWQNTKQQQKDTLLSNMANYLFCHTDVNNIQYNSFIKITDGTPPAQFKNFDFTFTGHIHHRQELGNSIFVMGSPYSMTMADVDNTKGFYLLDLETDVFTFFENTISPVFRKFDIFAIKDFRMDTLRKLFKNNFVSITTPVNLTSYVNTHRLNELFPEAKKLTVKSYRLPTNQVGEILEKEDVQPMSILEHIINYTKSVHGKDEKTTKVLIDGFVELHNQALAMQTL
jgi:DNA repair exonuclease SbcCD nuclease subunit